MRVRLLGPVEVAVDDVGRPVPGLRRRAVLATLALHPGDVVSTDSLIAIVWGGAAPATAATTLQSHVSRLRRILGPRAILSRAPGYTLNLGAEASDAQIAERLIRQGGQAADLTDRVRLLDAATALWRGRPLADLAELSWFAGHTHRLDDLLLQARHALADARLALGEHVQLIPELEARSRQLPFHEQTHGQLMLALYRAGRQGDALAVYRRLRSGLDAELGVEPSEPLRDLEVAILRQDDQLIMDHAPALAPASRPAVIIPAQLPPGPAGFTGRAAELARLDRLVAAVGDGSAVTSVICGPAGIGKTSLAVHWAHRVAAYFPDGQLYVNLRGFDPNGLALAPTDAVRGFLDAFDIASKRIPAGPDAQIGLYRSIVAGKRVLVVLDNARDADQVRPLLPGAADCMTVVTSRNDLLPLVATEGAAALSLNLLSRVEARDLITSRLGTARTVAQSAALDDIIARCAGLPLALAIVTARAASRPDFPLSAVADELRTGPRDLDAFTAGDPTADVRSVLSWSYCALSADAATLFRLLGLHPGPDIAAPAAASLAGLPIHRTRQLLTELTRAHLLNEHQPGRYTFHDLLRAYAAEQVHTHDSLDARRTATHRMLDHYLHTAYSGNPALHRRDPIHLATPQTGVRPVELTDHDQAIAWFIAEHLVLLAVATRPPDDFDRHTWQLAWALHTILNTRGYWHENQLIQSAGLRAAQRIGDRRGQAYAHRSLAKVKSLLGQLDEADQDNHAALSLCAEMDDRVSTAHAYISLGSTAARRGNIHEALKHAEHAYDIYKSAGHRPGQANAANTVGWYHGQLGDHHRGLPYCQQALAAFIELDNLEGVAATWDSLGALHFAVGDPRQAADCYQHAIDLYRATGDLFNVATEYINLGEGLEQAGDRDAARNARQCALELLDNLSQEAADKVRSRLNALTAG